MLSKFRDDPTVQSPETAISLRLGHQKTGIITLAENGGWEGFLFVEKARENGWLKGELWWGL